MGWPMMDDGEWIELAQREMQAPRVCPACGGTYTRADGGHRHRAMVDVPLVGGGTRDVGVLVDVADVFGESEAITRAVRQVHGPRACWMPDSGIRGMGQVMRGVPVEAGGGMNSITGRVYGCAVTYVRR